MEELEKLKQFEEMQGEPEVTDQFSKSKKKQEEESSPSKQGSPQKLKDMAYQKMLSYKMGQTPILEKQSSMQSTKMA